MSILDELDDLAGFTRPSKKQTPILKKSRINNGVEERHCNRCKKWKSLDSFHKKNKSFYITTKHKTTHQDKCKECLNFVSKQYRERRKLKESP